MSNNSLEGWQLKNFHQLVFFNLSTKNNIDFIVCWKILVCSHLLWKGFLGYRLRINSWNAQFFTRSLQITSWMHFFSLTQQFHNSRTCFTEMNRHEPERLFTLGIRSGKWPSIIPNFTDWEQVTGMKTEFLAFGNWDGKWLSFCPPNPWEWEWKWKNQCSQPNLREIGLHSLCKKWGPTIPGHTWKWQLFFFFIFWNKIVVYIACPSN